MAIGPSGGFMKKMFNPSSIAKTAARPGRGLVASSGVDAIRKARMKKNPDTGGIFGKAMSKMKSRKY